jgi:outer membrane immunogenic protein
MAGTFGLGPGWFWRNEYRYASYDSKTLTDTNGAVGASSITFKPVVQTVNSEIVYKLNTGGPSYHSAPLPPVNWNGFYINGGIGYGGWVADTGIVDTASGVCLICATDQRQGGKGWLGVVGAGYDYQIMPRIVVGVFGDFDFSSLKGSIQDQGSFFVGDIKQKDAWAVGGRAGWLVTPRLLTYWNVGYSSARFSGTSMVNTNTGASSGLTTPETTFNGWFAGGGLEAPIMPNLFWRTEYRYASYDSESLAEGNGRSITFKPGVQTVTTQLLYKFDWWR